MTLPSRPPVALAPNPSAPGKAASAPAGLPAGPLGGGAPELPPPSRPTRPPPPGSLSYDGAYIISACGTNGEVGVWSTRTGARVATWAAARDDQPPRCAAWAPRRLMAATGTGMLAMWIPGPAALERSLKQPQAMAAG